MAATLTLRVYTSTNAATESSAVTGIDFISADNATNSLGNRQANPITVGTNSFEKWLKLKVDAAPANGVTNFQLWGDGAVMTSTTLNWTGSYTTGVTPVATASTKANTTFTNYTAGNKGVWDAASYTATNDTTKYAVFQLVVDATAGPGNWTQETINYSYDET
jgi:hypothetical protein